MLRSTAHIHSNLFWFDASTRWICIHTALEGRTRRNVESHPFECFSVPETGRRLPAETALEFSTEYTGVSASGTARVLRADGGERRTLQGPLDENFPDLQPGRDDHPMTHGEVPHVAVYAIEIHAWSGKREFVAE